MAQLMNPPYDFLFKVVLVGGEEEVKTGLLWAFTGSDVTTDYKQTIGVNFGINSVYLNECTVKLQIWDISFSDRIKYLRPNYFRGSSGCIMVIRSLEEAKTYLEELRSSCEKPIPVFFIYINDEPLNSELNQYIVDMNIDLVHSGFAGIEWLAEAMFSSRRTKISNLAALYAISSNEIQETLQDLHNAQLHSEIDRREAIRKKRHNQIRNISEILNEMAVPIEQDSVQIISSEALFVINIVTGIVEVFPLKCDQCRGPCKKTGRLCIIRANEGWSQDLDQDSLLILSSIYALINNQLPTHIRDQIKNILRCNNYQQTTSSRF